MARFYESSDYCGITVGEIELYYGYEYSMILGTKQDDQDPDEEWGFIAQRGGQILYSTPAVDLQPSRFDCVDCFMEGIAKMIELGKLKFEEPK